MTNNINWFPGHMNKSLKEISNIAKQIDMVVEVVDARAIRTSSNPEILTIFSNKPKLTLALKSDLADVKKIQNDNQIMIGSIKDKNLKARIIKKLFETLNSKITSKIQKGLMKPEFNIMIVGLPNVGKSSLINLLSTNKKMKVENRPGVTRTQQFSKINDNFLLYDTPGIFLKKINLLEDGYILALTNCIKKEVVILDEVVEFAYKFYIKNYYHEFSKKFDFIDSDKMPFEDFLQLVCKRYQFLKSENKPDTTRAIKFLFEEFSNGKILKVNYNLE